MTLHPITHVAIRYHGKTWALPAPYRHHHVLWDIGSQARVATVSDHVNDQGFLDSSGAYLTRREAYVRAVATGQLRRAEGGYQGDELFSEDVW